MKKNRDLQNIYFFSKVKSWIYHLFKKEVCVESKAEHTNSSDIQSSQVKTTNNFFEEYKMKSDRRKYLLDLQNRFESRALLEKDISSEDQKDLETLYIEQIGELKRNIHSVEYKIKKYN